MKLYRLLFIVLLLTSCSRLDLAVSFAPRFISNEIDDALDLDSGRYKNIKNTIAADIEKNKQPLFSEVIAKIDYLLILTEKKDISPDELKFIFQELKALQKRAVYAFKASFSEVFMPITKPELKNLQEYAGEKFKKSSDILADRNKYYRHYFKSFAHYSELLFDSASLEQEHLYRDFLDNNLEYFKSRNLSRINSVRHFDILFDKKIELLDYNLKFYAGEPTTKSEEFLKKQDTFNQNLLVFVSRYWNQASLGQKNHFRKYLLEMKSELKKIIVAKE